MASSKWNKMIPFCNGKMLHYAGDYSYHYDSNGKIVQDSIEWVPQKSFFATLKFVKWHHGRSAVYADFLDVITNTVYPVPLSSVETFMYLLRDGQVYGNWLPVKRGNNFLLEYTEWAPPEVDKDSEK